MPRVMVRYRVKPERVAENETLVRAVYADLAETAPAGLRYATFRLEDGVTFVHIASIETEDGSNPLSKSDAFRAFSGNIAERCDEPPVAMNLTAIGAYRFFGG